MINDLDARRRHWDEPRNRAPRDDHDLTDSLPYPFEGMENLFVAADVLEIGPGRGRQYEKLRGMARTYSACDISPAALAEPVFANATARYQLSDYGDDFGVQFDVVHFWYVLHHVQEAELDDFFAFVARHLRVNGVALFNSPQTGNLQEWYTGDGIGTTWMNSGVVILACSSHLSVVSAIEQNDRSSGHLFKAVKR